MTRDEILQMPAGREMDALVAEKLFGYTWENLDGDTVLIEPEELCANSSYFRTYWPNRNNEFHDWKMDVLPYSTDTAAAWEVVEKLYNIGKAREYLSGLYAQGVVDLDLLVHHSPDIDCRAAMLATLDAE